MTITWQTDCKAPSCPGQIVADDGQTRLVQVDGDCPGVATAFGWSLRSVQYIDGITCADPCEHSATDGTVPCPACGITASVFIGAARDYLDENDGTAVDDPGYFAQAPMTYHLQQPERARQ